MNNETKNDVAWEKLFDKHNILRRITDQGYFEITSQMINEFRESRLMTKFDHKVNLPSLFVENNLAILPITRGSYIISRFLAYKSFETEQTKLTRVEIPDNIESINFANITSESVAINCAYLSGMLSDFLNDDTILPTISGRMSSSSFNFKINKFDGTPIELSVENSQLEIDGGFEGLSDFCLIEAKNYLSDDFLVRQLYYPYRLWEQKITKKIRPVFLVYSNGLFHLYEYDVLELGNYNSLNLVKYKKYTFESTKISLDDIISILNSVRIVDHYEVTFPQADNFNRVINLCELLSETNMSRDEITLNYAFAPRQTNYYTDAGRFLGLIDKVVRTGEITYSLTNEGRKIMELGHKQRQLAFIQAILRHRIFHESLRHYLNIGGPPPKNDIVKIMEQSTPYGEVTLRRRASTVRSWLQWILSTIDS